MGKIQLTPEQKEELSNMFGSAYYNTFTNIIDRIPELKNHIFTTMAKAQWIFTAEMLGIEDMFEHK